MLSALWDSFTDWLFLWVSPVRNFEALWILVPIYLSWILTEFWQEKVRTSFGNAIANGVIPLWASVDWSRYLLWSMRAAHTGLTHDPLLKFLVYLLTLIYGLVNIVQGIRAKKFIHHFGRIREVSYCMIVFTSVVYGIVNLTRGYSFRILFWFPIFYFVVQYTGDKTPEPKSLLDDQQSGVGRLD